MPALPTTAVVEASELRKSFGTLEAVAGIDLRVEAGESFGLLGPNGAGKSSTMRMIACVSPPTGGSLRVLGMDPLTQGPAIRARLGVVPQRDTLDEELTVEDNIHVYGRYFGLSRAVVRQRTRDLLEFARLSDRARSQVEPLSGGMKRRLTIARALVNQPSLLLLDEPTTGLDPQARHNLWEKLFRLKRQGVTLLLTTHYMDEAEQLCDRLVIVDGGRVVAAGTPRSLIESYCPREVLELRLDVDEHTGQAERFEGWAERVEALPDRLLLYVDDGEAALDRVRAAGVHVVSGLVRRSSLEDVFLRLTGRRLVD